MPQLTPQLRQLKPQLQVCYFRIRKLRSKLGSKLRYFWIDLMRPIPTCPNSMPQLHASTWCPNSPIPDDTQPNNISIPTTISPHRHYQWCRLLSGEFFYCSLLLFIQLTSIHKNKDHGTSMWFSSVQQQPVSTTVTIGHHPPIAPMTPPHDGYPPQVTITMLWQQQQDVTHTHGGTGPKVCFFPYRKPE